jgi:tetratricopeptide (TPR) repeat protein/predicted Ser/Thr protein kinase
VTQDADSPLLTSIGEHYVVDRVIGHGGMATVYLCRDTRDDSRVAVKVLREELGSAIIVERFLREIAFASELDHPRIPKVLESGVVNDLPYYAMTYVEGESLKKKIEREKQLPLDDAIRIACEVIAPTAYAHSRGIVHRDIKPDNILIAADGVYVLDFGIARAIIESGVDRLTSTGVGVGTPAYMSPEQALGDRNLDARSDIYSLGCVVYEMIAGIPPFVGPTSQAIISRRFAASPPPLREVRDGVPEEMEDAVQRALARSPADRWPNVAEFGKALEACSTETATGAVRKARATSRRRTIQRIVGAAAVVAVVAAGILAWSRGRRSSFDKAQAALQSWNFDNAEKELRHAVGENSSDARAQLRLAEVMMLNGRPSVEWKPYARYATSHRAQLAAPDRKRTDALIEISAGNLLQGCGHYASLLSSRPEEGRDLTAELALADCLRADDAVVRDSLSPSGYRFRASRRLIDSLYEGLLSRSASNARAYSSVVPRLEEILPIDKSSYRRGILAAEGGRRRFLAAPALVGDTVAYVPYPLSPAGPAWRSPDATLTEAALTRNRDRLLTYLTEWSRLDRDDPNAHEGLARVLESKGQIADGEISAIEEVRRARELAATGADTQDNYLRRIRLATNHVGLYLRMARFDDAGILADSVLKQPRRQNLDHRSADDAALKLTIMAALRGRGLQAIELQRPSSAHHEVILPSGEAVTLQPALGADALKLEMYSEFGGPRDSLIAVIDRLSANLASLVSPREAEATRMAVFARSLSLAAPVIGPERVLDLGPTSDLFVSALKAFALHDSRTARRHLDSLTALHSDFAAGEITMDAVYRESWLRAALGDTAVAVRQLENALRGLPAALPNILRRPVLATSLVRAMALYAELANATGNREAARKWAIYVLRLWGQGDITTAATVKRMQQIQ